MAVSELGSEIKMSILVGFHIILGTTLDGSTFFFVIY